MNKKETTVGASASRKKNGNTAKSPVTVEQVNKAYAAIKRNTNMVVEWADACDDKETMDALLAEGERLQEEFKELRANCPVALKFDSSAGEYIPAIAEDGNETFVVRVARTYTRTYRVSAKTAAAAEERAVAAIDSDFKDSKMAYSGNVKTDIVHLAL